MNTVARVSFQKGKKLSAGTERWGSHRSILSALNEGKHKQYNSLLLKEFELVVK
jgi:hypothetical protein